MLINHLQWVEPPERSKILLRMDCCGCCSFVEEISMDERKMQLKELIDDPDHYIKSYKAFSASAAKLGKYANWGTDVFGKAVVAKLGATLSEGEELRILGVGSGSGEMDCIMMEKLLQRYPSINNRVVEPLQEMIVRYKTLVQSKSHELHGVTFDWREQTIEQYEKEEDVTKFHFISAVHSIYFVSDLDRALLYLYGLLEPGGVLLVILMSETSGIVHFRNHVSCSVGHHHYMGTASVRSSLDRLSIPHELYHQLSQVDITKCFDEASEEGSLVLDFLTQVLRFRETAPENLKRRAMECLGSSECSEKMEEKVIIASPWDTIIITKQAE